MKRAAALLASLALLVSLTGCYPAGGGTHPGNSHRLRMVVNVTVNGHPVDSSRRVKVEIIKADVTVSRKDAAGVPHVVHGINVDTGKPYPSTWKGYAPQQTDINYVPEAGPTIFYMVANLPPSQVRSTRGSFNPRLSLDATVALTCTFFRDDVQIPDSKIIGTVIDTMTIRAAQTTDAGRFLAVSCTWVDHSTH